ncbi:hypothetical protein HanXRQr2_Chr07g0314381 [Helianthus annuus]|uniref:Uncharacterized protein n=1 Tax=Helianthus annuus TaxID=4232 RepID=A0A9K3NH97_HELAN|nr:hypothetical protein HanXRQr2_Chr07g0314381 [Helianthus annuus]
MKNTKNTHTSVVCVREEGQKSSSPPFNLSNTVRRYKSSSCSSRTHAQVCERESFLKIFIVFIGRV